MPIDHQEDEFTPQSTKIRAHDSRNYLLYELEQQDLKYLAPYV